MTTLKSDLKKSNMLPRIRTVLAVR